MKLIPKNLTGGLVERPQFLENIVVLRENQEISDLKEGDLDYLVIQDERNEQNRTLNYVESTPLIIK